MISGQTGSTDFAVGLDVGTTKICAITGKREAGRMKIISAGYSPSYGLRKGIVVDMELTTRSIKRALEDTESAMGCRIKSVFVGIAGGHIKGFNGYGAIGIKGNLVREEDVDRLMESASAVCVPVDREILHVIPAGFRLDGHNGVKDPVGMHCDRLEAKVHIVTGSVTSVQNLIRCCETAGVEVADIILEPLASADAVLRADEKEQGIVLVDIGGGTTDIAVYREGMPRHTAVLTLGGNHITNDIAIGLGIPVEEAERIKKRYGHSIAEMVDYSEEIEVRDANGHMSRMPIQYLVEIIQPRCEEIMMLVRKEISMVARGLMGEKESLQHFSGVVLTGGTSLLRGIDTVAASVIGLPVRIGVPEEVVNDGIVNSPEYATGVGLVHYGLDNLREQVDMLSMSRFTSGGIFERMKNWVREYFK